MPVKSPIEDNKDVVKDEMVPSLYPQKAME